MKARMSTVPPTPSPFVRCPRSRSERAAAAELLALLRAGGDARTKKVRRIRRAVRYAQYENDLKLSVAVERLIREMGH